MTSSCGVDQTVTLMLWTCPFLNGFRACPAPVFARTLERRIAAPVPNSATDNNKIDAVDAQRKYSVFHSTIPPRPSEKLQATSCWPLGQTTKPPSAEPTTNVYLRLLTFVRFRVTTCTARSG